MINEYYGNASTPNDSFLMHYGIKGMKWGVIRKKLSDVKYGARRKYAEAKMKRLERNADLGIQQKRLNRNLKIAGAGLGTSMASLGAHSLQRVLSNNGKIINNTTKINPVTEKVLKEKTLRENRLKGKILKEKTLKEDIIPERYLSEVPDKVGSNFNNKMHTGISNSKKISYGIAGAGLGIAGVAAGRAALAAYRSSKRGHAKAVAKRDAYRKEMNQHYGKRRSRSRS